MKRTHRFLRLAALILSLILAVCLSAAAANAEATIQDTAVVHNPNPKDRLHLREQPSESAASLGKYYNGVVVWVEKLLENGWAQVKIGDGEGIAQGYMSNRYLTYGRWASSVESAMPTMTIQNAFGTGLNLRKRPSKSAPSLGLYSNGTSVQVLGLSENWVHVRVDGKTGFMMISGLSDRPSSSPSGASSSSAPAAWEQPTGNSRAAEWPLVIDDYLAVVSNPNPADRLHLRAAPNETAASLGKYYNGVQVVIDGPVHGEWTKVIVGSLRGYMKSRFLVVSGEGKPCPASAMPLLTVSAPRSEPLAKLYAGQSLKSEVLGAYASGTPVILMGFTKTWAHVIVDGRTGFMQARLLDVPK